MKPIIERNQNNIIAKLFLTCCIAMIFIMLPDMISNKGLFEFASDYALQQIPFYCHVSEYIKSNSIGWDWNTDLGTDLISSYGFYLFGSVFFWTVSWLSGSVIIYAMPFMIALKTSVGAIGAYCFIKRYVYNDNAAFVGAFMYAFSGFQMTSLIFNHFHDITALFPFLLYAFDNLVYDNKKGGFAFLVGLIAITNYFFFFGIVLFVIIYYILKCLKKSYRFNAKSFTSICIEALIGTGMAAIILIPTYIFLSSADRLKDMLYGVDLLSYNDNTIIPKIIQGLFLIPDPPSTGMLFTSSENETNFASNSLYLPLFTITGVFTYIKYHSKDWISSLLKICLIIALVPGLNSAFSLFNEAYYARWFFMPTIVMCLATAKVLDENCDLITGIKVEGVALVAYSLISCLPDKVLKTQDDSAYLLDGISDGEKELRWFSLSPVPVVFWQSVAFTAISLAFVYVYNYKQKKDDEALKKVTRVMIVLTVIIFSVYINNTISVTSMDSKLFYNSLIDYKPVIDDNEVFRITNANKLSASNKGMIWGYMEAGCYHSIEPCESDDFYYNVQGKSRMMISEYNEDDYPVYGLLSIKYIFNLSTNDDLNVEIKLVDLKGCSLYDKQKCFYIYKNDNFVPMGFMYNYCIDKETMEKYLNDNITDKKYQYKKLIMMRALVLDDEVIEKYRDYIEPLPDGMLNGLDENSYFLDCAERKSESCSSFNYDSKGYCAEITTDRKGLVYFSVPCSKGWSAKVNDRNVEIIKAHYGLSAIPVEPGENKIECFYETPGLKEGKMLSLISVSFFILYFLINILLRSRKYKTVQEKIVYGYEEDHY